MGATKLSIITLGIMTISIPNNNKMLRSGLKFMISVIMISVVMLNVIFLSVKEVPNKH
jgi:hypothetical protein